jgi:hypothetical protein
MPSLKTGKPMDLTTGRFFLMKVTKKKPNRSLNLSACLPMGSYKAKKERKMRKSATCWDLKG